MRQIFFFKRLKESVRANRANIACAFMIAMLTGACVKQTQTLPLMYLAFKVPVSNESQEIVCRSITHKKIKYDTTYCGTKSQLAYLKQTGMLYENGESGNAGSKDAQKTICRILQDKVTKIKTKYCAARVLWAYAYVCDSDNCECNDYQKLECRSYVPTGRRLFTEDCKSKALWAAWGREKGQHTKDMILEYDRNWAIGYADELTSRPPNAPMSGP